MTNQDREWIQLTVEKAVAKAMSTIVADLRLNCPVVKSAKRIAVGMIIGMTIAGASSPFVGEIIKNLLRY